MTVRMTTSSIAHHVLLTNHALIDQAFGPQRVLFVVPHEHAGAAYSPGKLACGVAFFRHWHRTRGSLSEVAGARDHGVVHALLVQPPGSGNPQQDLAFAGLEETTRALRAGHVGLAAWHGERGRYQHDANWHAHGKGGPS